MVNFNNEEPINLQKFRLAAFKKWLDSFDVVLSDCDGVLWLGNEPLPGSAEMINFFLRAKKKVYFITNNSEKTRAQFLTKAHKLNFEVGAENILSSAYLVGQYLKERNFKKTAYVIGTAGIQRELEAVGIKSIGVGSDNLKTNLHELIHDEFVPSKEIGAVVVGYDEHFSMPKLTKATTYLEDKRVLFVATNGDEREPSHFVHPGPGPIIASIENCSGRKATVVGKPNAYVCDYIVNKCGVAPNRTLMIGDRCNTDILFGKNCGFKTLLVESGIHTMKDVQQFMRADDEDERRQVPDFYCKSLGALTTFIKNGTY